eukprot:5438209-Alexandrium_andersonii.AAC.1
MHVFSAHRLRLTFKSGRTEMLLQIRGQGAKAVRRELFGQSNPSVVFEYEDVEYAVSVVPSYRHLGGMLV